MITLEATCDKQCCRQITFAARFRRSVNLISGNFYETVIQAEIMPYGVLPALFVLSVIREVFHYKSTKKFQQYLLHSNSKFALQLDPSSYDQGRVVYGSIAFIRITSRSSLCIILSNLSKALKERMMLKQDEKMYKMTTISRARRKDNNIGHKLLKRKPQMEPTISQNNKHFTKKNLVLKLYYSAEEIHWWQN